MSRQSKMRIQQRRDGWEVMLDRRTLYRGATLEDALYFVRAKERRGGWISVTDQSGDQTQVAL